MGSHSELRTERSEGSSHTMVSTTVLVPSRDSKSTLPLLVTDRSPPSSVSTREYRGGPATWSIVLLAVSTLLLALATLSLLWYPRTHNTGEVTPGRLTVSQGEVTQAVDARVAQKPTMELCPICNMMIGELDSLIQDKGNEKKIKEALETVCHVLPRPMRTECDHIVETYTDMIINMMTKDFTPDMVCSTIGLCVVEESVQQEVIVEVTSEDEDNFEIDITSQDDITSEYDLTHCSIKNLLKCSVQVTEAYAKCSHAHGKDAILNCIQGILGAGDCWNCVCKVIPKLC